MPLMMYVLPDADGDGRGANLPLGSLRSLQDACHVLAQKAPPEEQKVDLETKMTDSYRNIRTNVVLAWALSNGALVAAIISTSAGGNISSTKTNVYMAFLLYSVAGLAAVRFIGCSVYSICWLFQN